MKNRKRETCTSGTVRDEDGNILIYYGVFHQQETSFSSRKNADLISRSSMVAASRHPMENDRVPAPQTEPQGSRPVRQVNAVSAALGGLIATAAALGIGRFVYTPILPPMIEALKLSKSEAGLIASANFVGYLIGALLAAMPRLPGSRRLWLLGSLAVSAATTAGMGLGQTLAAFLILRFVGGAASAFVLILASTVVLEHLAEAERNELSAVHFAGVGTGIAISAALVAAMLHLDKSWRALWLASGVLSLAAWLAAALLLPRFASSTTQTGKQTCGVARLGLQRLVVAYGLFGFGYIITATFLVAIVRATPAIQALEFVDLGRLRHGRCALRCALGADRNGSWHPHDVCNRLHRRGGRCAGKRHMANDFGHISRGNSCRRDIHGAHCARLNGGARPYVRRCPSGPRANDRRLRAGTDRWSALCWNRLGSPG